MDFDFWWPIQKIQAVELDHFCKILLIGYPYCTDNPFSFQVYIYARCTFMQNVQITCILWWIYEKNASYWTFFFIILHTGWIICSDNFLSFQDRIFCISIIEICTIYMYMYSDKHHPLIFLIDILDYGYCSHRYCSH